MKRDRREVLCDAGIDVIAAMGARGLTHHNVDDEAKVARGSTSYYYRTRLALTLGVMERIAELDAHDVQSLHDSDKDPLYSIATLIRRWLSEPTLRRTRARHELFLIASREREVAQIVSRTHKMMKDSIAQLVMQYTGSAVTEKIAESVSQQGIWLVDGLTLAAVREHISPPSVREIQIVLEANLKAGLQQYKA